MADIFISYKREEKEQAQRLRDALEHFGYSVWFDIELLSGDEFRPVILEMIDQCEVVIVLWSRLATKSQFVVDEAAYALQRNKLLPAMLEPCDLPFGFGGIHADDLSGWTGQVQHNGFNRLLSAIERKTGRVAVFGATPPLSDAEKAEIAAFQAAAKLRSASVWKRFLSDHPGTTFRRFIQDQISELESRTEHTPVAPDASRLTGKRRLPFRFIALVLLILVCGFGAAAYYTLMDRPSVSVAEQSLWDQAKGTNTIIAYEGYLRKYPDGRYMSDAKLRRDELANAELAENVVPEPIDCEYASVVIYFEWDRTHLSPDALNTLFTATDEILRNCNVTSVVINGHSDSEGSAEYNLGKTQRMAQAVADALASKGVSVSQIETVSYGETRPVVVTGDNQREPLNRRVEVEFSGRYKSDP